MTNHVRSRRGSAGFTLVEVLVSLAIVALIGVGLSAISLSGVISIKDTTAKRQDQAVAAQLASIAFARDVQGASGVAHACADSAGGVHLVTLSQASEDAAPIEYRRSAHTPYDLIRVTCPDVRVKGATPGPARVLVTAMQVPPEANCDDAKCIPGTEPRRVSLSFTRDRGHFELVGTRRSDLPETPGPPTPSPTGPEFLALGAGTPLQMSGNPTLSVTGAASFNLGSGDVVIQMSGHPQLDVSGEFGLQSPGTCTGCDGNVNKAPVGYRDAITDPFGSLAEPDTVGMPTYKECRSEGRVAVCSPGVYEGLFPAASGGVSDYKLEPGIYVLKYGLTMSGGTLSGDGVVLLPANGAISMSGNTSITLSPPLDGPYKGVSVFQGRTSGASLAIAGNASLQAHGGAIYGATQHLAMSGTADIGAARVVTRTVAMSGNAKLVVGGA